NAACPAPELAFARPVVDALGRGEIGSGPRFPICAPTSARGKAGGHARDVPVSCGQEKTPTSRMARWHYLLRSNLTAEDPAVLWTRYVQLTQIEAVFRSLPRKSFGAALGFVAAGMKSRSGVVAKPRSVFDIRTSLNSGLPGTEAQRTATR